MDHEVHLGYDGGIVVKALKLIQVAF